MFTTQVQKSIVSLSQVVFISDTFSEKNMDILSFHWIENKQNNTWYSKSLLSESSPVFVNIRWRGLQWYNRLQISQTSRVPRLKFQFSWISWFTLTYLILIYCKCIMLFYKVTNYACISKRKHKWDSSSINGIMQIISKCGDCCRFIMSTEINNNYLKVIKD